MVRQSSLNRMVGEFAWQGRIEMTSGLLATIGVFALVVLFGLVIMSDRKKSRKEEGVIRLTTRIKKTPKEIWDAHVEKLSKGES
jgi:hypothetical protein